MDGKNRDETKLESLTRRRRAREGRCLCSCLAWLCILRHALLAFAAPVASGPAGTPSLRPSAWLTSRAKIRTQPIDDGSLPAQLAARLMRDGAEQPDSPYSLARWSGTRLAPLIHRAPGPGTDAAARLSDTRAKVAMARDVFGALLALAAQRSTALGLLTDGQQLRLRPVFRAGGFSVKVAMAW
ncbi:MAG: hypothetical protein IPL40_13730 [Proteobacteria bacterium]|nr:hypothetical protein [Pseudomonadota bacterium]